MNRGLGLVFMYVILAFMELPIRGKNYPIIFNFGDSNSDTGNYAVLTGISFPLPYGRTFFGGNMRPSDGRLIIDFLCESLNTSYLSPSVDPLQSDFHNGANFAVSAAKTLPRDRPFSLHIQVQQFLFFKSRYLGLDQGKRVLKEENFNNALYIIDIGQTDIAADFFFNYTYDKIYTGIPFTITEIGVAVQNLYENGGRNFWIHNTGPLGCLPQFLSVPRINNSDIDKHGCLKSYNKIAKQFNAKLSNLCNKLRSELKNITVVYTDIYAIKYSLIARHNKYGFSNPLMACCGFGGPPYNFNPSIPCLAPGYQVCNDKSRYISWDGIHYAEAANYLVASKILTTKYSRPKVKFSSFFFPA